LLQHIYYRALRAFKFVHIFDETEPFLAEVKPHVHDNGSEYGPDGIEAPLEEQGGRLRNVGKTPGLSTSHLLARVRAMA
jgi:bifunctional ADP-heptose synthase (sugar kinase/adenylyltransferase)